MARVRNKFEFELNDSLKKSKRHFGYEGVKFPYTLTGWYLPDWVVYTDASRTKVDFAIEAKGYFRPESKRRMVAVKKAHPWLDIRIVFYNRRIKDIRWADKHGFKYAIKTIPKEWLDDNNSRIKKSTSKRSNRKPVRSNTVLRRSKKN